MNIKTLHTETQRDMLTRVTFTGERVVPTSNGSILEYGIHTIHSVLYQHVARRLAGCRLLDIGCGTGHGAHHLVRLGGGEVWGTDISADAVHFAASYYPCLENRVAVCDAHHLSIASERFDAISAIEMIEHVESAAQVLSEVKRILRPEGLFFLSTPNRLVQSPKSDTPVNPYHVIEYTFVELDALLRREFGGVEIFSVVIRQRAFLARYLPHILAPALPFPLANLERFLYWHVPPWNKQTLHPNDVVIYPGYLPGCMGFFAVCSDPL